MSEQPPKWAMRFLEKTCASKFLDELEGDLLELFDRDIQQLGAQKAKKRFIKKALLSPRWHRLPTLSQYQPIVMYKSHFKVAFRHALRHRSATLIQGVGLVLGLTAVLFIGLYLKNELSVDRMHVKGDQLYRVLRLDPVTGERGHATSSLHGAKLQEEHPFISICRFGNDPVKIGEVKPLMVEDFHWADSTFFEFFSFNFIHGDPASCLDKPNSLVITASVSQQLFGNKNAFGQTIPVKVYDGDREFLMEITGVVEDPSPQSHIQFAALGAMANAEDLYKNLVTQWGFSWLRTYIQVPADRVAEVQDGMPALIKKYIGEDMTSRVGIGLQAFGDIYLHSQDIPKNTFRGSARNLKIFGSIGLLILLISLLNYINLATARAVTRVKEVGIRKTLGAQRGGILSQFIVESVLFTMTGGVVALGLIGMGLPYLNELLELNLSFSVLVWTDWAGLITGFLLLGIVTGILPSLVMARLPLIGENSSAIQFSGGQWSITRKLFVGVQYFVTLSLLVSTVAIYKQYQYLKNFDLGFDASQLVHIPVDDRGLQEKMGLLKEKMSEVSGVLGVTATGEDLPSRLNNTWDLNWNGSNLEKGLAIDIVGVDQSYFDIVGIDFVEGQNFTYDFAIDSARSVVFNQKARQLLDESFMVGQEVRIASRARKLIGVVENHHNTTLHSEIVPLAYFIFPPGARVSPDNLLIKLETGELAAQLSQMEAIWAAFSGDPFDYNFVDAAFAKAYHAERRFSTIVGFFTLIAIAISIVGLFGLVSFIVQRKLKEISIRRVLGATELNLMRLLGKDFLLVFLIALVLAIPIALHFITGWLNNFAYRTEVSGVMMGGVALFCFGISAAVIFYHLQRTAQVSPSEVLSSD